jgi:hypothetical protein
MWKKPLRGFAWGIGERAAEMCDVITASGVWDNCRRLVEADLAQFRADLAPLEAGEMQVGERIANGSWLDITASAISANKRSIATLQAVLAALETPGG